jgi:hypothetical protein
LGSHHLSFWQCAAISAVIFRNAAKELIRAFEHFFFSEQF